MVTLMGLKYLNLLWTCVIKTKDCLATKIYTNWLLLSRLEYNKLKVYDVQKQHLNSISVLYNSIFEAHDSVLYLYAITKLLEIERIYLEMFQ